LYFILLANTDSNVFSVLQIPVSLLACASGANVTKFFKRVQIFVSFLFLDSVICFLTVRLFI